MSKSRRIYGLAILVPSLLITAALVFAPMPFFGSTARQVLHQLGQPAQSTGYGDVVHRWGFMNQGVETLSALYQAPVMDASVQMHYQRACWRMKLRAPPPKSIAIKRPDLTCAGKLADGTAVGVSVATPSCAKAACEVRVTVETANIPAE